MRGKELRRDIEVTKGMTREEEEEWISKVVFGEDEGEGNPRVASFKREKEKEGGDD